MVKIIHFQQGFDLNRRVIVFRIIRVYPRSKNDRIYMGNRENIFSDQSGFIRRPKNNRIYMGNRENIILFLASSGCNRMPQLQPDVPLDELAIGCPKTNELR